MTTFLLRRFVPDYQNTADPAVRERYGKLAGITGIICNVLLFAFKLLAGTLSGSVSITADAVNNLSDASSSLVTLLGFRLAARPADEEHPYGHARMEYLSGLAVAVMILVIGVELVKSSVQKILHPEAVSFSALTVAVLVSSILLKLWMARFDRTLGKRIGSAALHAAAADSRSDVIATGAVLAACVVGKLTGLRVDGWAGLLVALFILWSGVGVAKDTIDPLLGAKPDEELVRAIAYLMTSHVNILGFHDLMVHDYGPGRRYASIHVEINKNEDTMACHARIDEMERECLKNYDTHLVIHYDPVVTDDPEVNSTKKLVNTIIKVRDGRLTIHDFRMKDDGESVKMSFDMILPEDLRGQEQSIKETVEKALDSLDSKKYYADITFDMESDGVEEG